MKQSRPTDQYPYPMARRIGYESLGLRRQTEIEFDPRKAALYTLIASVAVSAGATAYANISHEPIPFPHPTLDTRHEDVFDTHAPASTVTEQADGSQLYTPAHPDTAKEDRLLLSKVQLQEAAVSAGYGLEVAQDDAKLTQTMNAALQVLREDDFDQTDLTITNVIKHANVVALSDEQAAELKQAASHRKESVSQLIADYKNGKLGTDQTDATTVESLLVDNSNDSYTVRFDKDGRDFNATLYKIDDAYTLVAERPQTEKPAGGQYPIVIIPIPIPWFRRREFYEFNDRTYWTTFDGDLVKHSYAKESRLVGGAVRVNDAVQTTIIDQGVSAVDSRYATDRLYGPRLENGGFYGWQRGGSEQPVAEPEADPEPPVEDDKLATIIPFPLRPQAEIVAEPEVIEDASSPEIAPVPEYEPIPELEDAAEDEEKEPKRRLKIPLWLILGAAGTAIVVPTAIGITHHTGPTPVSPTHSSQPGNGASQPSNGKNASPAPLTPQQYIYRTITEATIAGQSISTIDGHRDELKTIGAPTDVHLYARIAEVDQPIPTAPVEKPQPTITIEPGEGGEQLMHTLGKNPEEWYKIARELHKAYPNEFYLDGSDVRITHTGPLPAQIIARIDGLTS